LSQYNHSDILLIKKFSVVNIFKVQSSN